MCVYTHPSAVAEIKNIGNNLLRNPESWHPCGTQMTQTIHPSTLTDERPPPHNTGPPAGKCLLPITVKSLLQCFRGPAVLICLGWLLISNFTCALCKRDLLLKVDCLFGSVTSSLLTSVHLQYFIVPRLLLFTASKRPVVQKKRYFNSITGKRNLSYRHISHFGLSLRNHAKLTHTHTHS